MSTKTERLFLFNKSIKRSVLAGRHLEIISLHTHGIQNINISLEDGASVKITSVGLVCENANLKYKVNHIGHDSRSHFASKNFLNGASNHSDLLIHLEYGATNAIADEKEENYLLRPTPASCTPSVISDEKTACGKHGYSCGELSSDTLNYLLSRGINTKQANEILVRAEIEKLLKNKLLDEEREILEKALSDFLNLG